MMMAKELIAFHSRTDENYFGGSYRHIDVGNTEVAANILRETTGADLLKMGYPTTGAPYPWLSSPSWRCTTSLGWS